MNIDLGKVYIVGDDGTYQPLGHITDAELTPTDLPDNYDYHKFIETIRGEFHMTVNFFNNQRKRAGLPLRRGIINKAFKSFWREFIG